ncbi:hypothetical protein JIN77_04070 [Verrucomicrobiaceae bacterium R5-34]|nr:hypothetical protein [Verrucomicrobiaceae bacterium R5-34]
MKRLQPRIIDRVQASGYSNGAKQAYKKIQLQYTLYYEEQGYIESKRTLQITGPGDDW